jgi:hypothetical protein
MNEDEIRSVVRDEINKLFTDAWETLPSSAVDDLLGAEAGEFTKLWNALFGIEGDKAA